MPVEKHAGDIGYIGEDGFVFLEDRMKRMIITTYGGVGYKAFPELVEAELCQCEDVADACVVSSANRGDFVQMSMMRLRTMHMRMKELQMIC